MDTMDRAMKKLHEENPYLPHDKRSLPGKKKKKKGGFGKIVIDKADAAFSLYIRLRDGKCVRCGRLGEPDSLGRSVKGLDAMHYFGRSAETTRFDELNADAGCAGCHALWESKEKEDHRLFKVDQIGEDAFQAMYFRSHLTGNKDRKMALIYWRARLKEDFGIVLS